MAVKHKPKLSPSQEAVLAKVAGYQEEVIEAVEAVLQVYRYRAGGGLLHCQISDGNLEGTIEILEDDTEPGTDKPVGKGMLARYQRCADALNALTYDGRCFACHVANGNDPYEWIDDYMQGEGVCQCCNDFDRSILVP